MSVTNEEAGMIEIRPFRRAAIAAAAALALSANASGALAFSATFGWCEGGASPSFMLKDVPAGTATVEFAMTDLDKPSFHHGGGKIGYRGQPEVPCGAFDAGFVGPSPPPGEVHTYQFVIKALGVGGTVLATTTARRKFPE
jgi:hypothetical protein